MEQVILNAQVRNELGKTASKNLRNDKLVPAVCYKDGKEAKPIAIRASDFFQILHTKAGENVLITLKITNGKDVTDHNVIIKEIQTGPVKDEVVHVDFNEISLTETINVQVPVVMHGEAKEVSREGGVIEHIIWELEVQCLPTNIPEKIVVEISGMKINDAIHVKDITVPEGVKVMNEQELVVLVAKPPAKYEEPVPSEEGTEESEPEIIAKGKKPDEGEAGEEAESEEKK